MMKKNIFKILPLLLFAITLLTNNSCKTYTAVITYEIEYFKDGEKFENPQLPSTQTVYIIGDHFCITSSSSATETKAIICLDSLKQVTYLDAMGMQLKLFFKGKEDVEVLKETAPEVEISKTEEKTTIAGTECTVYNEKFPDESVRQLCVADKTKVKNFMFYNELAVIDKLMLKYVKYEASQNMYIVYTATEIKVQEVPDSLFSQPEGQYKEINMLDFKNLR